ncbi:MAG: membrane protein insertion efficiency factor YidD [Clostridia bacterium]|nr:membrane protein insertion efficiency factor YidD [Clostridia bacterium]
MKKILIFLIKIYKKTLSPILDFLGIKCKYYPTCSEYTMQAIEKYGVIKGCLLGIKRILKCNPFSKGGYDPLK